MDILKNMLDKIRVCIHKQRINYLKTLYLNFMMFPLREAIKLPVIIIGPCRIQATSGSLIFTDPIKKGMLVIGVSDLVRSCHSKSYIDLRGKIKVGKNVVLRRGVNLCVHKNSTLELQDDVYIGDNNTIISAQHIVIGKATRVGNNTTFMDTDFHYIINTETKIVRENKGTIDIGENNWIGGNCIIKKNAKTPKGTIVAGPYSMVGKNYIGKIPENSIIGGTPAKLIVENMRRINNDRIQNKLAIYFNTHTVPYAFDENIDIDKICMP